ncbi:hypothetical protein DFO50_11113 [Microvirgula sp. AG722]|uniref:Uncharacterized protein n=1 Tax=Microvirgula aerodenitrificans TaxID=57480 RepID=A0A2S0P971_9NEIS|nr:MULTISPECIES: hypothetical protein [Microvirgula]AVY93837.1 hypothetical protein DAI18_07100 [Microvirgula aerodenitrificans]RAS14198.1 hypothetical protein DFO50_11113 [Microvirgula sp. AG722]
MPLAPTHHMPALIPDLAGRDEWAGVLDYLSLADLGRLRCVSASFSVAITPQMLEQTALAFIRREEGDGVSASTLGAFRIHPAAGELAAARCPAAACLASLHHVRRDAMARGGYGMLRLLPRHPAGMDGMDHRPVVRDGRMAAPGIYEGGSDPGWHSIDIRTDEIRTFRLPAGFRALASSLHVARITIGKHFLVPPCDGWVLADTTGGLHLYGPARAETIPLPISGATAQTMADLSCNGRFVGMVTRGDGEDSRVRCYDRERDRLCVEGTIDDGDVCQLSVSDDGTLFLGAHRQGYVFAPDGDMTVCPYRNGFNCLFRLSADGHFLMRTVYSGGLSAREGYVMLERRSQGQEILLPRLTATRPGFWSSRPGGIAFSALNALVAVMYLDGVLQVFDLQQNDGNGARVLAEAVLPWAGVISPQPVICFEGFDRVHVAFWQRMGPVFRLAKFTLEMVGGEAAASRQGMRI